MSEHSTLRFLLTPPVVWRNLLIAVGVGTLLTLANQYDILFTQPMTFSLGAKIGVNYLIPFLVSSLSAAANRC